MPQDLPLNQFVREFNLDAARQHRGSVRSPRSHQVKALAALKSWYSAPTAKGESRGALLVLPTGGGKTFTALRFLCEWPISDGYKVLWLAHTHHLLEQAFETFGPIHPKPDDHVEVATVRPPRTSLKVKVVSGMPGHAKVRSLGPKDDVVIGSLQTLSGAQRDDHEDLTAFIDSAKGKLFVVFDEAHHAPAPTYARFIDALRERVQDLRVLGLTATPVYENKLRAGWLHRLFPQGIIAQTSVTQLLADGVLARPQIEQHQTHFKADFDDGAFKSWSKSYGDLPPELIETLATNQARNDFIVETYLANRERYGRTLIFADRWFQCDYLRQALRKHGVKADVVYSHVDATPGTVEARNRRDADENTEVIRAFKRGELDVLINVRMLTEGTDVPNVQTVFLTRQTTSRVLMTQMVGRALRGPAFGGTETAYVVSFLDEWRQLIQWAGFSLTEGNESEQLPEVGKHAPLDLISIALVRRLAEQMYRPGDGAAGPFIDTLPLGWYALEFDAAVGDGAEVERVAHLVLVYQGDHEGFESFIKGLSTEVLDEMREPALDLAKARARAEAWAAQYFPRGAQAVGGDLALELVEIARHVAQNGEPPPFFPFEEREKHDLDAFAKRVYDLDVGRKQLASVVLAEFSRKDRYWRTLYGSYDVFRDQFELLSRRIENVAVFGGERHRPIGTTSESVIPREPHESIKQAVKHRDGYRCLCCGDDNARYLQVDHVVSFHHGGTNEMENLQTLCRSCNGDKGINEENFRRTETLLAGPRAEFSVKHLPGGSEYRDADAWRRCVRATLNHYFRCAAVRDVTVGARGAPFYEWTVTLYPGNDPKLVQPHLTALLAVARERRRGAGADSPNEIAVEGFDASSVGWRVRVTTEGTTAALAGAR